MSIIKLIKNAIITDIPQDEKIPNAPREISKKGNGNFRILNIKTFFMKTYFAARFEIKTASDKQDKVQINTNNRKDTRKRGESLIKINAGDQISKPNRKKTAKINEKKPVIVKQEFIILEDAFPFV